MNAVSLVGKVSDYGPKISWTEAGKPQTSLVLVIEEPGKDGASYKLFVPILIVGPHSEHFAEVLEPGDLIAVNGKLAYQKGKTKDSGKLVVVCYGVERLAVPIPARAVESAN